MFNDLRKGDWANFVRDEPHLRWRCGENTQVDHQRLDWDLEDLID